MEIGIDLGTTYSVIGVKGNVKLAEDYRQGQYLEEFDVTMIPGDDGDYRIPSVLWVDADDPTRVLVGNQAKEQAVEGESPIMFAKRAIGSEKPLQIHGHTFSAMEVATHVLRHLKSCAERALGHAVTRAVITHPAYFDPNQVQETRKAAVAAGFDMSSPRQLCMEPAAAAVAYLNGNKQDPLRILTYDLGGGTFDVTVLERREEVTEERAHDGDQLLGGYNFDRALVRWLSSEAEKKVSPRKIHYDDADANHRARRAQLLLRAERAKVELSRKSKVYINEPDLLVDEDGRDIAILETVSREKFVELISEDLARTTSACHSALAKAKIKADELDEILLVGGSTHGPWVEAAIRAEFEIEPLRFHPDMCVAAGAAMLAADLPPATVRQGDLELVLDVEPRTDETEISVGGRVLREGEALPPDEAQEMSVKVTSASGDTWGPTPLNSRSGFLVEDVQIGEGARTDFAVEVLSQNGASILRSSFGVEHDESSQGPEHLFTVLPKPLFLDASEGLIPVAEEGVPLPNEQTIACVRDIGGQSLSVDIYQGQDPIGAVVVTDIPDEAGEGSRVEIEVRITQDAVIEGSARVYAPNSETVVAERPVSIRFPPTALGTVDEMSEEFEELEAKLETELEHSSDPARRAELRGAARRKVEKIESLFAEKPPELQEVRRELMELRHMVEPKDDLVPPRAEFRELIRGIRQMIDVNRSDEQIRAFERRLNQLEQEGLGAAAMKKHEDWGRVNQGLQQLAGQLWAALRAQMGKGDELDSAHVVKKKLRLAVDEVQKRLNNKKDEMSSRTDYVHYSYHYEELQNRIRDQLAKVQTIPDDQAPDQALAFRRLVEAELDDIRRGIGAKAVRRG